MKLAWEILNVFAMYRMGFRWVLYPFPCNVLAVYLPGIPALAPSECYSPLHLDVNTGIFPSLLSIPTILDLVVPAEKPP